jgi:hypothetical protein
MIKESKMKVNFEIKSGTVRSAIVVLVVLLAAVFMYRSDRRTENAIVSQNASNATQQQTLFQTLELRVDELAGELSLTKDELAKMRQENADNTQKVLDQLEIIKQQVDTIVIELDLTQADLLEIKDLVKQNNVTLLEELNEIKSTVKSVSYALNKNVTAQQVIRYNRCVSNGRTDCSDILND